MIPYECSIMASARLRASGGKESKSSRQQRLELFDYFREVLWGDLSRAVRKPPRIHGIDRGLAFMPLPKIFRHCSSIPKEKRRPYPRAAVGSLCRQKSLDRTIFFKRTPVLMARLERIFYEFSRNSARRSVVFRFKAMRLPVRSSPQGEIVKAVFLHREHSRFFRAQETTTATPLQPLLFLW